MYNCTPKSTSCIGWPRNLSRLLSVSIDLCCQSRRPVRISALFLSHPGAHQGSTHINVPCEETMMYQRESGFHSLFHVKRQCVLVQEDERRKLKDGLALAEHGPARHAAQQQPSSSPQDRGFEVVARSNIDGDASPSMTSRLISCHVISCHQVIDGFAVRTAAVHARYIISVCCPHSTLML